MNSNNNSISQPEISQPSTAPGAGIQALILFLFSVVLYSNTLLSQYTADDYLVITGNKFTRQGISGIKSILYNDAFTGFFGQNKISYQGSRYRPLSQIWFALEYELFGPNPFIAHLTNVLLYGLLCAFLFHLLCMLFKARLSSKWYLSMPFVVTALFIVHPLHTEVVANVKGRDEIMGLFGSLAALYFILKYVKDKRPLNLVFSSISFLLALLSKEISFGFVLVIPLTLFVFTKSRFKDYAYALLSLFSSIVVYFVAFWIPVFGGKKDILSVSTDLLNNPFLNATLSQRIGTVFYTWGIYLKLLLFPHPLTHDYYHAQIPLIDWTDLRSIIPFLLYAAMAVYALVKIRKKDIVAFSILFFLIIFFPISNLIINVGLAMNERFMFVPLLGYCIVTAIFLNNCVNLVPRKNESWKKLSPLLLVLILAGYTLKTFTRNFDWKNNHTLFTTDIRVSGNSARCNIGAGGVTIEQAILEKDEKSRNELLNKALFWLKRGLEIYPENAIGWKLSGNAHYLLKNYNQSRSDYETFLLKSTDDKNRADALNCLIGLARFAANEKNFGESVNACRTFLKYDPANNKMLELLADGLENNNRYDTAVVVFKDIIEKEPQNYTVISKLGRIYGQRYNDINKAIEYLLKAHQIKPDDPSILENLGVAYGIRNDYDSSIVYLKKASDVRPDYPQTWKNLGASYQKTGDLKAAEECFKKAEMISR